MKTEKTEIAFSWDWKSQPDIPKIIEATKELYNSTGIMPKCYKIDTKMDSYGILLSIHKYGNAKEKVRKIWWELLVKQDS